jgi:hypothetical protein
MTTPIVDATSNKGKPGDMPGAPDLDALYTAQQTDRARETVALDLLAAGLAEVKCGTARRARAVHYLLGLERVLSQALGECGRDQYDKVITRYLNVRHGPAGGAA